MLLYFVYENYQKLYTVVLSGVCVAVCCCSDHSSEQ